MCKKKLPGLLGKHPPCAPHTPQTLLSCRGLRAASAPDSGSAPCGMQRSRAVRSVARMCAHVTPKAGCSRCRRCRLALGQEGSNGL